MIISYCPEESMHILLIEDNPDFGESLASALRHEGHVVEWKQTQEAQAHDGFDLVIDGVDGFSEDDARLAELPSWARAMLLTAHQRVKETDRALKKAQSEAQHHKRLAANLSHELKTPIAAILTTAQSTLRCERTSDKYKQALRLCERNSRSMSQLIRRMLDLARAGSEAWEPKMQTVEPRDLLAASIDLHTPLAQDNGVDMLLVCREGVCIKTDVDLLLIMVNNLIGNAIRYTPRGKSVIIRFSPPTEDRPDTISVIDEGPGIRPEVLPHIFEAFYQDDEVRSRKQAHTSNYGLGLALTAELAERLGVKIDVESTLGGGAAFHLVFPR